MNKKKILQQELNNILGKYKENIAIEYGSKFLTYRELDRRSNYIANWILDKGFKKETFIGIFLNDRMELIITILGILKAGCVFAPLDPAYPIDKLQEMINATDIEFVISDKPGCDAFSRSGTPGELRPGFACLEDLFPGEKTQWLEQKPDIQYTPDDKIYIYFTSGTTGTPKAIIGRNKGLLHFIDWEMKTFAVDNTFRFSQLTNPGFDVILRDIFVPLRAGAAICIPASREILLSDRLLVEWLDQRCIDLIHCVPGLFSIFNRNVSREKNFKSLKYILFAGEKVNPQELKQWYNVFAEQIQLVNLYGPTETTLAKVFYRIKKSDADKKIIPIGQPISGARVIILDKNMDICANLEVGELYIRTPYRSWGYYNQPELNRQKFLPNPFGNDPDDIIYKTGDLGRFLPDGNIELIGRVDRQVKIRGMRIELEGIESVLLKHPAVKEAAAVKQVTSPNGDGVLCAYITVCEEKPGTGKAGTWLPGIKEYLSQKLPTYMVPAKIIIIEKMPRNPNGKIDFKELPEPVEGEEADYIPPRDFVETRLSKLWCDVLKMEKNKIGVTTPFFQTGGTSLNIMSLITKIHGEFSVRISLGQMFNHPTIEKQAEIIRKAKKEHFTTLEAVEKKDYYTLSPAQRRLYFLQQMDPGSTAYNMPQLEILAGELQREKLQEIFKTLIKRHDSFSASFILIDEQPVQRVDRQVPFEIEHYRSLGNGQQSLVNEGEQSSTNEGERSSTNEGERSLGNGQQSSANEGQRSSGIAEQPQAESGVKDNEIINHFIRTFDLSRAPLLRVGLIKKDKNRHLLMVDMHHIITDGVSQTILIKDFIDLYKGKQLPPLPFQYKDFSEWQNRETQKKMLESQRDYWLKQFAGEIPVLHLSTDYTRPALQSFAGSAIDFLIDTGETRALNHLAKKQGATLYIVLLAAFNVLLAKLSNQEDIIIGTPAAGRRHVGLEQIIGMFVNTLAMRNSPGSEKKFPDFLEEVKENTLNAFENQDYPFEELVEQVAVNRDVSRNPLFDVMFVLQNMDFPVMKIPGLQLSPYEHKSRVAKFDLELSAVEAGEKLLFTLEYCTELFKQENIERFIAYFKKTVTTILTGPDIKISDIEIISEQEKQEILFDFNDTDAGYPHDKTIHDLFAGQVKRTPDHTAALVLRQASLAGCPRRLSEGQGEAPPGPPIKKDRQLQLEEAPAVTHELQELLEIASPEGNRGGATFMSMMSMMSMMSITYRELNRQSNQLAHLLRNRGVKPDTIVAILLERSLTMIVAMIGILKAGGAYLPIDPGYPGKRIAYMLEESHTPLLLTQKELVKEIRFQGEMLDLIKETGPRSATGDLSRVNVPADAAYVIYTSGTTGAPKGTVIEHRNVVRLLFNDKNPFDFNSKDVWTMFHSYGFDFSVWEMYGALLYGGKLIIIPKMTALDPTRFLQVLTKEKVTVLNHTPTAFYSLNDEALKNPGTELHLRYIIFGGEALKPAKLKEWKEKYPGTQLINMYGITETTVHVTYKEITDREIKSNQSNIGKPIPTLNTYVMDKNLKLLPIGIPGELCVGGKGVSRGYLNKPGLTGEKFVKIQYKGSELCYRSGDRVKMHKNGELEYLGRIDNQVKIRGHRVELGEIETRLLEHRKVKEAVVLLRENPNNDKYICAYTVPDPAASLKSSELREYLDKRLPGYMMPAYFVILAGMPLTANGKIDREALPAPGEMTLAREVEYAAPRNHVERILLETWQKVLGKELIGIDDNFFEIGGDSIKTIQIISRMKKAGYKIEMKDIFRNPRISQLAPLVSKIERIADQSTVTGHVPLTPIQKWFFENQTKDKHHYNQAVMLYFAGGITPETVKKIFLKLQEHHDALRMIYKQTNAGILQVNQDMAHPLSLQVFDYRNRAETKSLIEGNAREIQASIDLETGPLMKLGLFHLDDGDRLLIVIQHLVIDGVSWRILFEDIETLSGKYQKGEPPVLPLKTDSFKAWSKQLGEYAGSDLFLKEKTYWAGLAAEPIPGIKKDFDNEDNYMRDVSTLSFSLDENETYLLLNRVNEAFATGINDILITALGLAAKRVFGNDRLLIALEGHGREEILKDIDISRTVGWFTSIYPVLLDFSYEAAEIADRNLARQIKQTKETLRRVPHKGVGYGILEYLTPAKHKEGMNFRLNPQVVFNYLGQFDEDVKQNTFSLAAEPAGDTRGSDIKRDFQLEIDGRIIHKQLLMSISYNRRQYKPQTIETLLAHYKEKLSHIISFCAGREQRELTPGDLTYKELSIEALEKLQHRYPIEDIYTLSPMQEGMLFHSLYNQDKRTYFEQISYRLHGKLDIGIVKKSLNELSKRHEILRAVFVYEGVEQPLQIILKDPRVEFLFEDIRQTCSRNGNGLAEFVKQSREKDRQRAFDLNKDVLMRISVLQAAKTEYEVTWSFHHILMDGWCIGIMNAEFFKIYNGLYLDRPYCLPGIKPYRTYIEWLKKQDKETSKRYWEDYLASYEETTGIPKFNTAGTFDKGYEIGHFSFVLDQNKLPGLNKLAGKNQVTLNTVIQAVWAIVLGKYNDKEDVVFGAVVSGRPPGIDNVETMVGLFISTIPVRVQFAGKTTFKQLLRQVQKAAIASEPHHYYPLAEIQAGTTLKQSLLDHILIFENYPIAEELSEITDGPSEENKRIQFELSNIDVFEQTNYDFNLIIIPGEQLTVRFDYNANVYEEKWIKEVANHLREVTGQILENQAILIGELTLLSREEKRKILYDFNDTDAGYPGNKTIRELFEEQAARSPDSAAVIGTASSAGRKAEPVQTGTGNRLSASEPREQATHLTYGELNQKSNRLARHLLKRGVQPDTIVGIRVGRSIEMITGILGILKAGGAYLPIDSECPRQRLDFMLKDSNARVLVVDDTSGASWLSLAAEALLDLSAGHHLNFPASQLPGSPASLPAGLAYVIYTSGTTGKPKGVLVDNRNAVNLVWALNREIYKKYNKNLHICLVSPFVFDASVKQIFTALLLGHALHIVPGETRMHGGYLFRYYKKYKIDISDGTPTHLKLLLEGTDEKDTQIGVKEFIIGGEVLSRDIINKFFERFAEPVPGIVNIYGPSECTVDAACCEVTAANVEKLHDNIPIGHPIANCRIYILNKGNRLQPVGVPGEISIGGAGVGRGYLNNPGLTAGKFVRDVIRQPLFHPVVVAGYSKRCPKAANDRLYRTGDLARWLPDGNIEFLGRSDHQVKIRGFRIELEEIEAQMLTHENIKEVVVLARQINDTGRGTNNEMQICAYFTADKQPAEPGIRDYLSTRLPHYMIPAHFVEIDKIPLTPNGKVERNALPAPGLRQEKTVVPPQNETEYKLVKIWSEILGIEPKNLGRNDNFFQRGGHSISAITLVSRIHKEFDVKFSLPGIFAAQILKKIATHINESVKETYMSIESAEEKEYYLLSSAQKRLFISYHLDKNSTSFNEAQTVILEGDPDKGKCKLADIFTTLIQRHESLRTSFHQVGDEPVQKIHHKVEFAIEYHETTGCGQRITVSGAAGENLSITSAARTIIKDFLRPFDLERAPLVRAGLIKEEENKYILLVDMHHIISDGISNWILINDFISLYEQEKLPGLRCQYKDYAGWQNRVRQEKTGKLKQQETYWLKKFAGDIPGLHMPTDYPGHSAKNPGVGHVRFTMGNRLYKKLENFSRETDTTIFMILLSVYNILLFKYTRQEDIVVGSPITGRNHADLQNIIGMFINMLALRNRPEGKKEYRQFLAELKKDTLTALENQDYQFDELVLKLGLQGKNKKNPLFDVVFNMLDPGINDQDTDSNEIGNLKIHPFQIGEYEPLFNLVLSARKMNRTLRMVFAFSAALFKTDTIERMADHYIDIIEQVVEKPGMRLTDIKLSHTLVMSKSSTMREDKSDFDF